MYAATRWPASCTARRRRPSRPANASNSLARPRPSVKNSSMYTAGATATNTPAKRVTKGTSKDLMAMAVAREPRRSAKFERASERTNAEGSAPVASSTSAHESARLGLSGARLPWLGVSAASVSASNATAASRSVSGALSLSRTPSAASLLAGVKRAVASWRKTCSAPRAITASRTSPSETRLHSLFTTASCVCASESAPAAAADRGKARRHGARGEGRHTSSVAERPVESTTEAIARRCVCV
mmetsp:Transcript_45232/g.72658  ORF Transcript_45232/g.72658 Transcript_45232/m.72658 type:complete len:243 (+) Transcript_45232:46-774(+)